MQPMGCALQRLSSLSGVLTLWAAASPGAWPVEVSGRLWGRSCWLHHTLA